MIVSYKDNFDTNKIEISSATKNEKTNKWECPVKYDGSSLLFSSPRIKFIDGILTFKIQNKKKFIQFLEELDTMVIDYLHKNSETIFKGKSFTLERLQNSIQPQLDIDEDGTVRINAHLDETIRCFDVYGESIPLDLVRQDVTAVLKMDKLIFTKDLYRLKFSVSRLKMSKPEREIVTFENDTPVKQEEVKVDEVNDPFF
jgi:hypothetical protein